MDDAERVEIALAKEILKEAEVELENRRAPQAAQLLEEAERRLEALRKQVPNPWSRLSEN